MNKKQKKALAIGAGVAALTAAAAGTYLFAGKKGAKNRAKVKRWVDDAKRDVSNEVSKLGKVTKQTYNKAVDTVLKEYQNLKQLDKSEILAAASELKKQWDITQGQLKKAVRPVLKTIAGKKTSSTKSKPKSKKR